MKAAMKRPAAEGAQGPHRLGGRLTIHTRSSPAQQYIMAGKVYVCSATLAQHPDYVLIIQEVYEAIKAETVTSKEEARALCKRLVASDK